MEGCFILMSGYQGLIVLAFALTTVCRMLSIRSKQCLVVGSVHHAYSPNIHKILTKVGAKANYL